MNSAFEFSRTSAGTPVPTAGARTVDVHPSRPSVVRHSQHPWRIPASPHYLRALREADLAVRRAMFRRVVLQHSARLLEP